MRLLCLCCAFAYVVCICSLTRPQVTSYNGVRGTTGWVLSVDAAAGADAFVGAGAIAATPPGNRGFMTQRDGLHQLTAL